MSASQFFAADGCSFCCTLAERIPTERTVTRGLDCAIGEDCIGLRGDVITARGKGGRRAASPER